MLIFTRMSAATFPAASWCILAGILLVGDGVLYIIAHMQGDKCMRLYYPSCFHWYLAGTMEDKRNAPAQATQPNAATVEAAAKAVEMGPPPGAWGAAAV